MRAITGTRHFSLKEQHRPWCSISPSDWDFSVLSVFNETRKLPGRHVSTMNISPNPMWLTYHPLELLSRQFFFNWLLANLEMVSAHSLGGNCGYSSRFSSGSRSTSSTKVNSQPSLAERPWKPQSQNTIFLSLHFSEHWGPLTLAGWRLRRCDNIVLTWGRGWCYTGCIVRRTIREIHWGGRRSPFE